MIRFWILVKNGKSVFGFKNPDLDFLKTNKQTKENAPLLVLFCFKLSLPLHCAFMVEGNLDRERKFQDLCI